MGVVIARCSGSKWKRERDNWNCVDSSCKRQFKVQDHQQMVVFHVGKCDIISLPMLSANKDLKKNVSETIL